MKNKNVIITLCLLFSVLLLVGGCKKSSDSGTTVLISQNGGTQSHKTGKDCLGCHQIGGNGKGVFTMAGTVYDSALATINPNGSVQLFSGPNGTGTLIKDVAVDGKGNFYTTEAIDWGSGLYTVVTGTNGSSKAMVSSFATGACNLCHGKSIDRIWVD
ncbi:MAG: hypothetical protein GY765_43140 [bacterium]|nr:hypothetical protein [bacterium]